MMAPPAVRGEALLARQQADGARALGASADDVAAVQAAFTKVVAAIRSNASPDVLQDAVRGQIAAQYDARSPAARAALGERSVFLDNVLPVAMAQLRSRAIRELIDFDPGATLATVRCPTLALFGGKDAQAPPDDNRPALEAAFAKGGHARPTIALYADANHLFIAAKTGQPSDYASLPKAFVPGFLDDVTHWVSELP